MLRRISAYRAAASIFLTIVLLASALPAMAGILNGGPVYLPIILTAKGDIKNPGFEQGQTGWSFYANDGGSIVTTLQKHSGQYSARLGSATQNSREAWISQQVTVPNDRYMLTYWHYIDSQESYCPQFSKWDYISVLVNDIEVAYYNLCTLEDEDPAWIKQTFNLSGYRGPTPINLKIRFISDTTNPSDIYVDDFAFVSP